MQRHTSVFLNVIAEVLLAREDWYNGSLIMSTGLRYHAFFHLRSRLARIAASLTKHCRRTSGQRSSCWGSAWLDGTLKARDGRRERERRESALRDSLKRWAGGIWQEARCDPKDGMHGASLLHLRAWCPFPALLQVSLQIEGDPSQQSLQRVLGVYQCTRGT